LSGGDWILDTGTYKGLVDISSLGLPDQDVVVSCRDTSTNMVITPQDVDLGTSDMVIIWMPVNTVSLSVTVVG